MAFGMPGGNAGNTYIPTLELSGHLLVNFAQNMKQRINNYTRITPTKQKRGAYLKFDPLDLARMPNAATEFDWAPGTPSPDGFAHNQGFQEATFTCFRRAFSTTLDKESVDVANWDVKKTYADMLGQMAMTHRIYKTVTALTTSGNFAATHVVAASTLNGSGFTDTGTTASPLIKKTLDAAGLVVQADTMGRVRWGEMSVLINPTTALKWSQTRELREYLMQSPESVKEITLDPSNLNAAYGLPKTLYGFKIIVEDAFYNTYNRGNSSAAGTVVMPDNKAVVLLAEGDLVKPEGGYSFNTCHVFAYEDMTVEEKDDPWDRLLKMRVVMNYTPEIVAPASGFIITNLFS